MRSSLQSRVRLGLLWFGMIVVAVAAALAVQRLYATAQRELAERSRIAAQQAREKTLKRIREVTDELRHATIRELAGFHVEGLTHALQEWDKVRADIVGTFEWNASQGFRVEHAFPSGGTDAHLNDLPRLWAEFRAWRAKHSEARVREPVTVGAYRSTQVRTWDNPSFPATELRYQSENIDMLNYDRRPVDPWAGWAGNVALPEAPWLFWYQLSAESPIRAVFLDTQHLLNQMRSEFAAGDQLVRLELVPADSSGQSENHPPADELIELESLPGYGLRVEVGELFRERQASVRFAAWTVALLLGLFLVGVAALVIFSRRETRNAERKTTFVSLVSHELRTPLTSIRMFADMLGGSTLSEDKRSKYAATIARESRRLGELIERLLTFNALEKGRLSLTAAPMDVAAVARETIDDMIELVQAAGMQITSEFPEHVIFALGDRGAVKQALLNLIDNAIKYARSGGALHVALNSEPDIVRLRIADRGPGIARSLRSRLFEPFVQGGPQTLTDKPSGVGLGLSIARDLLRQIGGDLVLVGTEGGATFEIRLRAVRTNP